MFVNLPGALHTLLGFSQNQEANPKTDLQDHNPKESAKITNQMVFLEYYSFLNYWECAIKCGLSQQLGQ